ncbi:MAG: Ig-like domain-containing protein, partial [Duncaniella sp.]|nr:Ig-like domain-containing protein [Duncaniella sp.]
TYKGDKAGDVYLHVRVRFGLAYSYSNVCRFTLLPPERPIESISFALPTIDAPLNSTIVNEISILPEDATYTAVTYKSSDTKVVTVSATAIKTTKTPGSATVTVSSTWNPSATASFDVVSALRHPVTDFSIKDVDGDVIVLNPKQMLGIIGEVSPADADIPDFNVTLTGNGTARDNYIATMYKVNYWDVNNTRIQFYELSGHRAGECTLTLESTDGSGVSKTFKVRVEEQDRTPLADGYVDGTLLLNEEWFGHTNGGMNYLTPDGEMMYQVYERENPGMSFGCTSQYAAIWADRLIAVSKQAADGGDPLPGGGRVVVADAKTLKRLGSIDNLMWGSETKSADGRAVVGATPSKVYVGSSSGIYIV